MITINTNLKIYSNNLSGSDYQVLTQMYLPLIAPDALSIYLALNNRIKEETPVRVLLDQLSISNISIFIRSLNKLEAIGLVKEYSKNESVILKLKKPLSPKNFLSNHFLTPYLISKIGEVEFNNLKDYYFKEQTFRGYTDDTKAFDEVFKKTKGISKLLESDLLEEDDIKIRNSEFDYTYFKLLFDDELPKEILDDELFANAIIKISYQYSLNEQEMKEAILRSKFVNNVIDYEQISMHAGYIYQAKEPNKKVNFTEKEVIVNDNSFTTDELRIIELCKNSSIPKILAQMTGDKGSLADVRDFTKLQENTNLPIGVINFLIIYLQTKKKSDNLSYTYIEKVARNWMKENVKTVEDAFKLVKEKESTKKGKVVLEPAWESKENKDLTQEEINVALQNKKKAFGDDDE